MIAGKKQTIYALVYDDFPTSDSLNEGPSEVPFYIGRTTNGIEQRLKEHRRLAREGTEDKYEFIRALEARRVQWGIVPLHEVAADDSQPYELWYVIEYVRQNHDLKNMRLGDSIGASKEVIQSLAENPAIDNVHALTEQLKREASKAPRKKRSSEDMQVAAVKRSLRHLRTEIKTHGGLQSTWKIYDTGEGTEEICAEARMTLKEVAALNTPAVKKRFQELHEWGLQVDAAHKIP